MPPAAVEGEFDVSKTLGTGRLAGRGMFLSQTDVPRPGAIRRDNPDARSRPTRERARDGSCRAAAQFRIRSRRYPRKTAESSPAHLVPFVARYAISRRSVRLMAAA